MKKTLNINTIHQCNHLVGVKTLHPLVSIIDLSKIDKKEFDTLQVDFYCVALREYTCEQFSFGRKRCDYSDGTIIFLSPGGAIDMWKNKEVQIPKGWMLAFNVEFIQGTYLGMHIDEYTFFSYSNDEALHISQREKKIFIQCLEIINEELHRCIDKNTQVLVTKSIDLLLTYCTRFYERQFIIRDEENKNIIKKASRIVYDYFVNNKAKNKGLPSAKYCSDRLKLSPNYFTDLLKQETGYTVREFIQNRRIEIAKQWIIESDKSISEIACVLGYSSTEYFNRLFEKLTGHKPQEYRLVN